MTKNLFVVVLLAATSSVAASEPDPRERLAAVAKMVDELRPRVGVSVSMIVNSGIPIERHPVATGRVRGELTIIFSDEVLAGVSDEAMRAIVAHELAHVKLGHIDLKKGQLSAEKIAECEKEADRLASSLVGKDAVVNMIRALDLVMKNNNLEKAWTRRAIADRIHALED